MAESSASEQMQGLVGADLSAQDAEALAAWYAAFARAVAAFPAAELGRVEPPLRSAPGPSIQ